MRISSVEAPPLERTEAEDRERVLTEYYAVRQDSERLCEPLSVEDYGIQTATEVSPPKWHLAHTTWFFETFLLQPLLPDYREVEPQYAYLFNSYYDTVGAQWPRPERGLLSRPTVEEVYRYRTHVDRAMEELITRSAPPVWEEVARRLTLGLNHEQQHQELMLTDIKYNFGYNPLRPVYRETRARPDAAAVLSDWLEFEGGEDRIGFDGGGFCFDNETPHHRVLLEPHRLASRLVSNGEYMAFIEDGGYRRPELWLSDGWSTVQRAGWTAPLYWEARGGEWWQMTLGGMEPVDVSEPVCHVSYYEADAFARWAGRRLPSEAEWETVARRHGHGDNLREAGFLHPTTAANGDGLQQAFGDCWEWTASPYTAYPGYRRGEGAFGEYNGKFMCNQMVLRGGSCVTPPSHLRLTYRNFFYPWERWQFTGIRLADDG